MEPTHSQKLSAAELAALRAAVNGDVIAPGDPGYDQARMPWNLAFDQHPAVIVAPLTPDGVAAAVRFAAQHDLGIAVQATGHGVKRRANGAMLIRTNALQELRIDAEAHTAWVGAGLEWGPILARAQESGLAPLLGSSPGIGAVGYTLGGGLGWLARKYGLSLDSVNSFAVVTADGEQITASKNENSDLFWGLCGGGGSLAIVTGMEIQLYPVTDVYAGNLLYPIEQAADVLRHYRDWISDAPDELTTSILVMNFPPLPMVPEFLREKSFAVVRGCYCGPVEEGEALLNHFRQWREPFFDDFKTIPFAAAASISQDPPDPLPGLVTGSWLDDLNDDVLDTLVKFGAAPNGSPLIFAEIRHAGGAIARIDEDSNAYSHRQESYLLDVVALTPTPQSYKDVQGYVNQMFEAIGPHLCSRAYANFLEGEEAHKRLTDAYTPDHLNRLRQLKSKFDPQNLLRYSTPIQPAG